MGTGEDLSIAEFAQLVARVVEYEGESFYDASRPDGAPRKLVDIGRLSALGWRATTPLEDGLRLSYRDFLADPRRI